MSKEKRKFSSTKSFNASVNKGSSNKEERRNRLERQYSKASKELKAIWRHWDEVAIERAREDVREIIVKNSLEESA